MNQTQRQYLQSGLQGAAAMGRTYAVIMSLISTVIGILLIIWINKVYPHSKKSTIATITNTNCQELVGNKYSCELSVKFPVGEEEFNTKIAKQLYYDKPEVGNSIPIYYNYQNPKDVTLSKMPLWFFVFIIIIGCILIFFSILYMIFVLKYKGLAVISGIKTVVRQ